MAWETGQKDASDGTYIKGTVGTTGVVKLGDAAPNAISTWAIQTVGNGGTYSLTIQACIRGPNILPAANLKGVPYQYLQDATAVDKLADVPITADGIYYVRADFLDLYLNASSIVTAALHVYVRNGLG